MTPTAEPLSAFDVADDADDERLRREQAVDAAIGQDTLF